MAPPARPASYGDPASLRYAPPVPAPEEGYVSIGQMETCDHRDHFMSGEVNRVVVQHIDDCAAQAWIPTIQLSVNLGQAATTASHRDCGAALRC